jgi:hypothetical protein
MTPPALRELETLRNATGGEAARRRLDCLRRLERARLPDARAIGRLHEQLLFLRAYPDDARVLAQALRMLAGFARRADLRAQRDALENSGIAGTAIRFPFFWPSAQWLARRWPSRITLDRLDRAAGRAIAGLLGTDLRLGGFRALDRIRRRGVTDAVQFIRMVEAMPGDAFAKERFYDAIEPVIELRPGRGTPNRTLAAYPVRSIAWRRRNALARPDLAGELRRPPRRVRRVARREGERLLELARAAMATRSRDLDAFAYGEARAVRLVDDGAGLAFSLNGVLPERDPANGRLYGIVILMNGMPIGYLDLIMRGAHAEPSFNIFAAFRGADAGAVYARVLAMAWHVLGARRFLVAPYQLGRGNAEALESGAWWFYWKLGFRPRAPVALALARRELARRRRLSEYRSSAATLARLARWPLFFLPQRGS